MDNIDVITDSEDSSRELADVPNSSMSHLNSVENYEPEDKVFTIPKKILTAEERQLNDDQKTATGSLAKRGHTFKVSNPFGSSASVNRFAEMRQLEAQIIIEEKKQSHTLKKLMSKKALAIQTEEDAASTVPF